MLVEERKVFQRLLSGEASGGGESQGSGQGHCVCCSHGPPVPSSGPGTQKLLTE